MANMKYGISENMFCLAFAAWLTEKSMGLGVSGVELRSAFY